MEILQQNLRPCIGDDIPTGTFVSHSRFTSVVNFINSENQIVYITTNEDLMAANALFLPGVSLNNCDSIMISPQSIILDDRVLDRQNLEIYDSTFSFEDVDLVDFESRLFQIPSSFAEFFPEKSMIFLFDEEKEKSFATGFDQQFMLNVKKCCELILAGEVVKGIETIRGTGYGLTPSGDDFIAGFLLGLKFNEYKFKKDLSSVREKVFTAAGTGNLLTASFLRNAKNGKYFKPLKKVLLLLCGMDYASLTEGMKGLLSFGATSGADFFCGYIYPIKHKTGI